MNTSRPPDVDSVYRALGTGSGRVSSLHPFGMHPNVPATPVISPRINVAIPAPLDQGVPGFGVRPLTEPHKQPFGLGSERQLAAFIKGPHMQVAPSRFAESFKYPGPPCFQPPHQSSSQLPALRTNSRRGLSARVSTSSGFYSPRATLVQPEEAGAGLIVNGSARSTQAFQGRHSERVMGFAPLGATPYPGVWSPWPGYVVSTQPPLEPVDDEPDNM